MTRARIDLGKKGEDLAQAYLCKKGYRLLERGYRCRLGETDLIMQDGDTIVFVEVRARSSARFGDPAESVNAVKQRKIVRMAQVYLKEHGLENAPVRFDVVAVLGGELRHIPDAFRT